jgi:hypothetical protein
MFVRNIQSKRPPKPLGKIEKTISSAFWGLFKAALVIGNLALSVAIVVIIIRFL